MEKGEPPAEDSPYLSAPPARCVLALVHHRRRERLRGNLGLLPLGPPQSPGQRSACRIINREFCCVCCFLGTHSHERLLTLRWCAQNSDHDGSHKKPQGLPREEVTRGTETAARQGFLISSRNEGSKAHGRGQTYLSEGHPGRRLSSSATAGHPTVASRNDCRSIAGTKSPRRIPRPIRNQEAPVTGPRLALLP